MSKLYDTYSLLKKTEDNSDKTLYLFKSGIFFILLDDDAKIASNIFNLKLTFFTDNIVKCGFPMNSLEKYSSLLSRTNYTFKIIDTSKNTSYTINNYKLNEKIIDLLNKISAIDTDSTSIREAYSFLEDIKCTAKQIIEGESL